MGAPTVDAILASTLADRVGDQLQVVTYKWLSRHHSIPYDTSKRILFEFLSQHSQVGAGSRRNVETTILN
jgi:hypothetical protein